jgi:hypothetical protein
LGILYVKVPQIFNYRFDTNIIDLYKRSQDIPYGVANRVHISDSDIYLASGYLYAEGEDPTQYNFQHPPLIKYLFGLFSKFMGNPYIVQIIFGIAYLWLTYILGLKLFNKRLISVIALIFLVLDPVFFEVSTNALLDLGQSVFAVLYLILILFYPQKTYFQGLILGLFLASKFWSTAMIFLIAIYGIMLVSGKKINFRRTFFSFAIAFVVFIAFYARTYLYFGRKFDILFYEAKTLKFMLNHNSANAFFGSLSLFLTGNFNSWWGSGIVKSTVWSIFWPITLLFTVAKLITAKDIFLKQTLLVPVLYFLLTVSQVPFTRYFIIILPFLYLATASTLTDLLSRSKLLSKYATILTA